MARPISFLSDFGLDDEFVDPVSAERVYENAPEPKELIVVDGAAHAQHLFGTPEGDRVLDEIVRFLER